MYGLSTLFSTRSLCSVRYHNSDSTKKLLEFLAEMPKANSSRISEAQRQRQQISKKSEKYGPSSVYLQVLGSGARGAPNTLYLFTDQKRYLFNCGECTQRLAHEHKVKLSRLDHIFITNKTWRNIGGLPGLSLTLQDVGVPNITLHGPEGLDELYQATKRFVIMKDMNVTMAKCSPAEDFSDNVMTVKYVLLGPLDNILTDKDNVPVSKKPRLDTDTNKEFEEFIHDDTDYYRPEIRNMEAKAKIVKDKDKTKPKSNVDPIKKKTEKVLQEFRKKSNPSVAYICTLHKRLGTLDLAKCVERGVKPGPLLGQLKSGQDVVLPDGTLVLSKDVKTPDDPGPVFIVLDVPEISYLKESEFSAHFDNANNPPENVASLVVHFTPPHVFHHPRYRTFMAMFGASAQHLVVNSQNACLGSAAVHRSQHKLHLLDADMFPLLRDASLPAVWTPNPPSPRTDSPLRLKGLEELKNKIALAQFQNIISLEGSCRGDGQPSEEAEGAVKLDIITPRTLTMVHLRPKKEVERSAEPKLHIQEYIQESMDMDGFAASLEQFRHLVDTIRYAKSDSQKEYPKVVFLGTGSCIPSKTRNTSAIVLHIDENRSLLMDCGEGTFGQLVRFYGPKKVNAFLRTLQAIYISHLHADHHIGLIGVIQARREAFEETGQHRDPLCLLAPGQIVTWLTLYDQQFEKIRSEFTLIPNQSLLDDAKDADDAMTSATLARIGVQRVRTCLVAHCPNAFGVAIDVDGQNKITYSGDTLPCDELVTIGENSTLLIHEATMEDELVDEARMKMHSTTSQAIAVGQRMGARYTVLTHFSQRYARLPRLSAHILNDNRSVGVAFDNMQITMSDLELLPHMYAPLQLMFAEHCVEMELKAAHRARQKERRAPSPPSPPPPSGTKPPSPRSKGAKPEHSNLDPKSLRCRWVSPGCRPTGSTPVATYLESNASRLRQEVRGMVVSGIVRRPRSRSNSSTSPTSQTRDQPSNALTRRSDSRNLSGTTTSVKRYEDGNIRASEMQSPRGTSSITPSLATVDKLDRLDQLKVKSANTPRVISSKIIDTRSKTLNRIQPYRPPTAEEVINVMTPKIKAKSPDVSNCNECDNSGYGKPLVTPVNKKLIIRRENVVPPLPSISSDRIQQVRNRTRSNSRGSGKAENKEPPLTAAYSPPVVNKGKIPAKVTLSGNKLRPSRAYSNELNAQATTRNGKSKIIRPLSAMDRPKSPSPSKTPPRSARSVVNRREIKPMHMEYHQEMKVMNIESKRTLVRPTQQAPATERPKCVVIKDPHASPSKPTPGARAPPVTTQKHSVGRDVTKNPYNKANKPNSNRSFKPQLEDIKSSFMLMNTGKRNMNNVGKNAADQTAKAFDDEMRRQQLLEVKRKFQSRSFLRDSRYDKIEGLNWISWK